MFSDDAPIPEPGGSLDPPARKPPTAIAAATPPAPREPRSIRNVLQSDPRTKVFVDNAIRVVFDAADNIADEIASLFRIRRKAGPSSPNLPAKIPPVD
jgi:hypothetical protein